MNDALAATLWTRPNAGAVEQYAAQELQRYLKQMTGQEIIVRHFAEVPSFPGIYLARGSGEASVTWPSVWARLPAEGYHLQGNGAGALLMASEPRGILFAAYRLLKHLGARWFFPGSTGEIIPHINAIKVDGLLVTTSPVIAKRGVIMRGTDRLYPEWVDFAPRIGLNAFCLETQQGIHTLPKLATGHGLELWLRRHFYSTSFCSQDERTLRWLETLTKGAVQSVPEAFDSVQLRPADSANTRCLCPGDVQYNLADQVMRFINRMANANRDVRKGLDFTYVAYQTTWGPPPTIEPAEGITLSMGVIHRCFNHAINDPSCWINSTYKYQHPRGKNEYGLRPILEELAQRFDVSRSTMVDYMLGSPRFSHGHRAPWQGRLPSSGGVIQRDIQYYNSLGIPSIWSFVIKVDDLYLQRFTSPSIYQWGDLLWDPKTDLHAGVCDFCRHYLGEEGLHVVFPLDELSDPEDATLEQWLDQSARLTKTLALVREAAAGARNDLYRQRLTLLAAEQDLCLQATGEFARRLQSSK